MLINSRHSLLRFAPGTGIGTLAKGRSSNLEEGLLPLVKLHGNHLVLFADLRNRNFLQQMKPEDFDFVFETEVTTTGGWIVGFVFAHTLFLI